MATELTLYHGSSHIIEHPAFGSGKPYNDYGLGFYCTESDDLAREWASSDTHDGFVNTYAFDTDGLDILDLQDSRFTILHWLAILLDNRTFTISSALAREGRDYLLDTFLPDYRERDVIRGYRADDSYFAFAQDFLAGAISVRALSAAMRLGKLGEQVVIKSEAAFGRLSFLEASGVDSSIWYGRRMLRDRAARREYLEKGRHEPRRSGDLYLLHILDEGIGPDDPRLR